MTGSDRASRIFAALAEPHRRDILRYFVSRDVEAATYDELLEALLASDGPPNDRSTAEIQLRHADLPALEQCGLVERDERSETVRYQGDPLVDRNVGDQLDRVRTQCAEHRQTSATRSGDGSRRDTTD